MTLKEFQKLHKKDSFEKKISLLCETVGLVENAVRNQHKALLLHSEENRKFHEDTLNHMHKRLLWIIKEIRSEYISLETRCEAYLEYLSETGEEEYLS